MSQNLNYQQCVIKNPKESPADFYKLYSIFKETLKPDMRMLEFKAYYLSANLEYISVTFIKLENEIIGFCSAAFYTTVLNGKKSTIGRAATGILPAFRGKKLPKWNLYKKFMLYRFKNPGRSLILTAYVANPLIYAMISKYTGISYPKKAVTPPPSITLLKQQLLASQRMEEKEIAPFVLKIHFCVEINDAEKERIISSKDPNIIYYLLINPFYREQVGVLVIIPVTLGNIFLSIVKFIGHFITRFYTRKIKSAAKKNRMNIMTILQATFKKSVKLHDGK